MLHIHSFLFNILFSFPVFTFPSYPYSQLFHDYFYYMTFYSTFCIFLFPYFYSLIILFLIKNHKRKLTTKRWKLYAQNEGRSAEMLDT